MLLDHIKLLFSSEGHFIRLFQLCEAAENYVNYFNEEISSRVGTKGGFWSLCIMTNDDIPDLGFIDDYIPIPEMFHSFLKTGPFDRCLMCERDLLIDGTQYLIEKAFKQKEVIFEFAMCLDCHDKFSDELSKKTTKRLAQFFSQKVDLVTRREELLQESADDVNPWLDTCLLTGKKMSEVNEYQIYGHCDGPDLLFSYFPYMICGEGIDQIIELLSKKTIDVLGDFTDKYLGCPPEFQDKPILFF
jgi:hypothetical protein